MHRAESIQRGIRDPLVDREPRFETGVDEAVFRRHREIMERDRAARVAVGASGDPITYDAMPLLPGAILRVPMSLRSVSVPAPQDFVHVLVLR